MRGTSRTDTRSEMKFRYRVAHTHTRTHTHTHTHTRDRVKPDSHIACRAHAAPMPFPCHAVPLWV